ncbi:MAG: ATP-dependent DNA helicase RecG [Chthonomonas sp.]|nr:ATP-dependent DNA helicase RecG [Chthonomonas sp.]
MDTGQYLDTEVMYVKGVGPNRVPLLHKLGLRTARDILYHFPRRYEDRTQLPPMRELCDGQTVTVRGELINLETRSLRGGKVLLRATLSDGTGRVTLVWFNQPWLRKKLEHYNREVIAFGTIKQREWSYEISSPEIEIIEDEDDIAEFRRIVPVYPLTEGLGQKNARSIVAEVIAKGLREIDDPLPDDFRRAHRLQPLQWSLRQIHAPEDLDKQAAARKRLVFEEFFFMQLQVQMRRNEVQRELGVAFQIEDAGALQGTGTLFAEQQAIREGETLLDSVHRMLPFTLTGAQQRVISEIWRDMARPVPMNRLVQGDVGSGKTAVAACAMLAAIRNGYQSAMMVPTEILAEQHAANLHRLFDPIGVNVVLLTGKLPAAKRKKALQQAAAGEAQIVVGTHALISDGVAFAKLGLCVIDEQHRFGVMQRLAIRQKSGVAPDVLVMTATPIPRTLTMTLYGDLDLSVIDEMPAGRKPIKTYHKGPHERTSIYSGLRKLIDEGRQAYYVTPMIEENAKIEAQAAEEVFRLLSQEVYPDLKIGLLHGQMKLAEKDEVMGQFRRGDLHILVSTVVIEVGVDVPNASVMVIEDASRFGLAQLHQLRGRVGRGDAQSYCILIDNTQSLEASERMGIMVSTTDGFKIAEADLRLRGPGEIAGTRQSGSLDFRLADLVQDSHLLEQSRQAAIELLETDPDLSLPQHAKLLECLSSNLRDRALMTVS